MQLVDRQRCLRSMALLAFFQAQRASTPSSSLLFIAGAVAAGADLDRVVVVLTIVYLVGQIAYLGWRWVREWRQRAQA